MRFDWWARPSITAAIHGRTVYLLGTAGKGPIREPVVIQQASQAWETFGTEGTLARAAADIIAMNPGAAVHCFRLSGSYGICELMVPMERSDGTTVPTPGLTLRTVAGSDQDNQAGVRILDYDEGRSVLVMLDQEGRIQRTYWLHDYAFMGDLVRAINLDAEAGLSPCVAATSVPLVEPVKLRECASGEVVYFTGASSEVDLTKDDLFLALEQAYDLLLGQPMDVIVPLGVYLDDAYPVAYYGSAEYAQSTYGSSEDRLTLWDTEKDQPATFHSQLVEFCRKQMNLGQMTHGVIGTRPLIDPAILQDPDNYVVRLVKETALGNRIGLVEGEGEQVVDYGGFISIVVGDLLYQAGTYNEHWDTGALAYAAMLTALDASYTTTNKPVPGNPPQRVAFETQTLKDLAFLGVVAFRFSVKQQTLVVHNGVTAALPDSDLHQIANVRMMQLTLAVLNDYLQELKGRSMDELILSQEVPRRLTEILDSLKTVGVLTDYRFTYNFLRAARMLVVQLSFRTRNMVNEISVSGESMLM